MYGWGLLRGKISNLLHSPVSQSCSLLLIWYSENVNFFFTWILLLFSYLKINIKSLKHVVESHIWLSSRPCHSYFYCSAHKKKTAQPCTTILQYIKHNFVWRMKDQLDVTCYFISLLVLQAAACNTSTTQNQPHHISNTQRTENKTTDVVIQQHSRKLLMMDILMSETCWAHKT